jgi:hypothetical protein
LLPKTAQKHPGGEVNAQKSSNSGWERFAHKLLATTCLGLGATGIASASVINEGIDFSNSKGLGGLSGNDVLPIGATQVNGNLGGLVEGFTFDDTDWFEFQGLVPGTHFILTGIIHNLEGGLAGFVASTSDSPGTFLGASSLEDGLTSSFGGTVPADGKIDVNIGVENSGNMNYTVTLTTTPEPSLLAPAGLALAGALAWRRKRKNQD